MKTMQWNTVDKTAWSPGPWQAEPDKMQWQDEKTGYACVIHRSGSGALCGYVGVGKDHPAHGLSYNGYPNEIMEPKAGAEQMVADIEIHGGRPIRTPAWRTRIPPTAFVTCRNRGRRSISGGSVSIVLTPAIGRQRSRICSLGTRTSTAIPIVTSRTCRRKCVSWLCN